MSDHPQIARINALTQNARSTWFALLSVLLFVGVTLMGVEPIDFYGVDRATDLPLISVSVPTPLFFYAAPILVAAIYAYFHLYLIRLWDALGSADPEIGGKKLGESISPWLLSDSALFLRRSISKRPGDDACTNARSMEWPNAFWNFLLAWVFGPAVLLFMWLESLAARNVIMTGIIAACLLFSLLFAWSSAKMLLRRMRVGDRAPSSVWDGALLQLAVILAVQLSIFLSLGLTSFPTKVLGLARLDLSGQNLSERPKDWLPCEVARKDALSDFSEREDLKYNDFRSWPRQKKEEFFQDWALRRRTQLSSVESRDLSSHDFRGANLHESFGVALKLPPFPWEGARLSLDLFEGTRYFDNTSCSVIWARLNFQGMSLRGARLDGADLSGANFRNTDLSDASLNSANMNSLLLEGANLSFSQLRYSTLRNSILFEALLQSTDFTGSNLQLSNLQFADLRRSTLVETNLLLTDFRNAELDGSLISGSKDRVNELTRTRLQSSQNRIGALRYIDLSDAVFDNTSDWRNVFFDSSVIVPQALYGQVGPPCLWDWIETQKTPLTDEEFFGYWRGWIEDRRSHTEPRWEQVAPDNWLEVPARYVEECQPKTEMLEPKDSADLGSYD